MNKVIFILMAILIYPKLLAETKNPPKIYIDRNENFKPFQCSVNRKLFIYKNPGDKKSIGQLLKDRDFTVFIYETHVIPTEVEVIFKHNEYMVGDKFYLLTSPLTGMSWDIWFKGKKRMEYLVGVNLGKGYSATLCSEPSDHCWAIVRKQGKEIYWVQIYIDKIELGWAEISDRECH